MKKALSLILVCLFLASCAEIPTMSITEADIDAKIAALSGPPKDPDAVLYNATNDRYELKPEVYKRAVRDGIVKDIQDEKIDEMNAFLTKHPPMMFKDKVRWMGWGAVLLLILEAGAYFAVGQ